MLRTFAKLALHFQLKPNSLGLRSTHDGNTTVEGCWNMLRNSQLLFVFVSCILLYVYLFNKAWGLTTLQPAAWAVVATAFTSSQWSRYGRIFGASYHMTLKILCMPTQRRQPASVCGCAVCSMSINLSLGTFQLHVSMHVITWNAWFTTCLEASRLTSSPFWAATLEILHEARWWFWSPPSTSCSFAAIALGALVLFCCCFSFGALVACCALSHQCRQWLWHRIRGALQQWSSLNPGQSTGALQRRFRERRAWVLGRGCWTGFLSLKLHLPQNPKHSLLLLHIPLELLQLLALRPRKLKLKLLRAQFLPDCILSLDLCKFSRSSQCL